MKRIKHNIIEIACRGHYFRIRTPVNPVCEVMTPCGWVVGLMPVTGPPRGSCHFSQPSLSRYNGLKVSR